ncbi:MAG TPA: hypothetical protein VFO25_00905 [Candidatus Eremiobacteraceae bacterium]|nr:hypothetical protein [Candidatus Eremiobacteraceae bacterium]
MRTPTIKPTIAAAAIVVAAGALAAGLALKPAVAGPTGPNPDLSVTCTSTSPCQVYKNKGLGAGIQGINTKNNSSFTSGVVGSAGTFGNGVTGFAGTSGNGVSGSGGNTGVNGSGGTWGVFGYSSAGNGVEGQSVNGNGVIAFSSCCAGLTAASSNGEGVFALSESSSPAIGAIGSTGDAIDAFAGFGGSGQVAFRGTNNGDNGSDGNGADIEGSYIGIIARNAAGIGFPLVAADTNGTDLMFVDSAGDLFYHGGLFNFAKTQGGGEAVAYGARSASPTIEDNGTAQLVSGSANVVLDSAFSHTIDNHQAYQVMLTPDGDTKGLYVASKSPTGFVVREVQGGHATISFDYHIYATALGQAGVRMTEMSAARAAAMMPHAKYVKPTMQMQPKIKLLHK